METKKKRMFRVNIEKIGRVTVSMMLALMVLCGSLTDALYISTPAIAQEEMPVTEQPSEPAPEAPAEEPQDETPAEEPQPEPQADTPVENPEEEPDEVPETEVPTNEPPATYTSTTDASATDAPATDAPATDAPATDTPATDTPATDAPATDVPATDAPTTEVPTGTPAPSEAPVQEEPTPEAPVDERPMLQRIIEDEGGAYVNVMGGKVYKSDSLRSVLGTLDSGLVFATAFSRKEDANEENAVRVIFRTANDELLEGWVPASEAVEQNRQQTIEELLNGGETFLVSREPDLPLPVIGYEPKQETVEETEAPVETEAPTDTEAPVETAPPAAFAEYRVRTIKNDVNLRKEPSLQSGLMRQLDKGSVMTVTAEITDSEGTLWYRVTYHKGMYYVLAELVEATEEAEDGGDDGANENGEPVTDPADTDEVPAFAPAAPMFLQQTVTDNGDGTFTYTAPDGTTTLLAYGSAHGNAPAFYALDANGVANLAESFPIPLELTVEDDEPIGEEADEATFEALTYEGELPQSITDNGDGFFTYTAADGEMTLLIFGCFGDTEPAFYVSNGEDTVDISKIFPIPTETVANVEEPAVEFAAMPFEYELPEGVADNNDGTFTFTDTDGSQLQLVYGSKNETEAAFYILDDTGTIGAEWMVPVQAKFEMTESDFVTLTPDAENLPEFYQLIEVTPKVASFLRFFISSAFAEDTAPVYMFTDSTGQAHYRVYGAYNGVEGFYESDEEGNFLSDPPTPVSIFSDARLWSGESRGVNQSLDVVFEPLQNSYKTGSIGRMRLEATLNSAVATDYADVKIKIPNGFTYSQFPDDGSSITINGHQITRRNEGSESYLCFQLTPGETISNCYVNVEIPNGITANDTKASFVISASNTFTGYDNATFSNPSEIKFTSDFEWLPVEIDGNPAQTSFVAGPSIKDDISYVITAHNKYNGNKTGVIFTEETKLTGTITLPTGLNYPGTTASLSGDGKTVTINGTVVATFDRAIESVSMNGNQELIYVYQQTQGNVPPTSDLSNVDLGVTLHKEGIVVNGKQLSDVTSQISHQVTFDAKPYNDLDTAHQSTDSFNTTIPAGVPKLEVAKANSPAASVILFNKGTDAAGTGGDEITYTLTVSNLGAVSTTVDVSDLVPEGTAFVPNSTVPATGILNDGKVIWKGITVPGGTEALSFTFKVRLSNTISNNAQIVNTAQVLAANTNTVLAESNQVKNVYSTDDKLRLYKSIETSGIKDSVYYNDEIPYTLTLTNLNMEKASSPHVIVDTLPSGLTLTTEQVNALSTAYPGASYLVDGETGNGVVSIPVGEIPAGEKLVVTFSATMPNGLEGKVFTENEPIVNSAEIQDVDGTQTSATTRFHEKVPALLYEKNCTKFKEVSANHYVVDYTITITNNGFDTSELVKPVLVKDTMKGGLTPYGAGDATEGTITVKLADGTTIPDCRWTRSETKLPVVDHGESHTLAEAYEYYVEIPIPSLLPGEEIVLSYQSEAEFDESDFEGASGITVWNDVDLTPNGGGIGSPGVGVDLTRDYSLRKSILDINGATPANDRASELASNDVVTYEIVVSNRSIHPVEGMIRDELPIPQAGVFSWEKGVSVTGITLTGSDGASYDAANSTIENNSLVFKNVILPPKVEGVAGTLTLRLTLTYPDETFEAQFGALGDMVVNGGYFFSGNPFVSVRDSVIHTVVSIEPEVQKSADKTTVDSAPLGNNPTDTEIANRTVVYTISDFEMLHAVKNPSLLDDLTDVLNHMSIKNISLGQYEIKNMDAENVDEYTVDLSYSSGVTETITVKADGSTVLFSTPLGHTVDEVLTIKWNFGALAENQRTRSVTILTEPTITAEAKDDELGNVSNTVNMSFNGMNASADVLTKVTNSNLLKKVLYDANGAAIDNDTNVALPEQELTYQIELKNMTEASVALADMTLTDQLRYLGLDTTYNGGAITVTAEQTTQYGTAPAVALAPATQNIAYASMTNNNTAANPYYEFTVPFTGGVLQPGDTLRLTYKVKTNKDYIHSVNAATDAEKEKYKLYNYVKAEWPEQATPLENESGPFATQARVIVDFKKGLVQLANHVAFNYGGIYKQQRAHASFRGNVSPMDLSALSYYSIDGFEGYTDGSNLQNPNADVSSLYQSFVYGVTLANAVESTASVTLEADKFAIYDELLLNVDGATVEPVGFGESMLVQECGNGYYFRFNPNVAVSFTYPTFDMSSFNATRVVEMQNQYQMAQNGNTTKLSLKEDVVLAPGENITYFFLIQPKTSAGQSLGQAADMDAISNTAYLDVAGLSVPDGVSLETKDLHIDISSVAGYRSKSESIKNGYDTSVQGDRQEAENVELSDGTMLEKALTSTTESVVIRPRLAVEKNWIGSYAFEGAASLSKTVNNPYNGMTMEGTTVSPDANDHIVWQWTVKNTSSTTAAMDFAELIEAMPKEYRPTYIKLESNMNRDGNPVMEDYNLYSSYTSATDVTLAAGTPANFSITRDAANTTLTINLRGGLIPPYVGGEVYPFQGGYLGTIDAGVSDLRMAPGEQFTFTMVMEPIQGESVQLQTYANTVTYRTTTARNTNAFQSITAGSPVRDGDGDLIGASSSASVSLGGENGSMAYKQAVQGATVSSMENDRANRILTVDENGDVTYDLIVKNTGDWGMKQITVVDRMPQKNDVGEINLTAQRESEFSMQFAPGAVTVQQSTDNGATWTDVTANFAVQYKNVGATEAFAAADFGETASTGWSTSSTGMSAIRVYGTNNTYSLAAKALLKVSFKAKVGSEAVPDTIAWNNFGYSYMPAGGAKYRIKAEPSSVGVRFDGVKLAVYKTDTEGAPLAGAVFSIYDNAECTGTPVAKLTTDATGYAELNEVIRRGCYWFKETTTPNGYVQNDTVYTVDVSYNTPLKTYNIAVEDGSEEITFDGDEAPILTAATAFENVLYGARLAVLKTDRGVGENTKKLQGAVFGVYATSACGGTPLYTLTTGVNGTAILPNNIAPATYWVKEITAPDGYVLSATKYKVDLTAAAHDSIINVADGEIIPVDEAAQPIFDGVTAIKNSEIPRTVTLTKKMTPPTKDPTDPIVFTLTGVFSNSMPNEATRTVTFTAAELAGGAMASKMVYNLIQGNTYTLVESGTKYQMTATAAGNATLTPTRDAEDAVVANSYQLTITGAGEVSVAASNYAPTADETGKLSVKKEVVGKDGIENDNAETFEFTISGKFRDPENPTAEPTQKSVKVTVSAAGGALDVPNVVYGERYVVTETSGGENYTVSYKRDDNTADAQEGTVAANGALTMRGDNVLLTIVNTRKDPGKLFVKKQAGLGTTLTENSFSVAVAGQFADDVASPQTITIPADGTPIEVPHVLLGESYTVTEAHSTKYTITYQVGTADTNQATVYGAGNDQTVTVINTKATEGQIKVTKSITDNSFKTVEEFTFQLVGPTGVNTKTYVGTISTNSTGVVNWTLDGAAVTLDKMMFGEYKLSETTAGTNYKFKSFTLNGGAATEVNNLTFTLNETTAIANITAINEVKTGDFRVDKVLTMSSTGMTPEKANQSIYVGLYPAGGEEPLQVKEFVWDDTAKKYQPAVFTNIPYGNYDAFELLSDGHGGYIRVWDDETFPYKVTGEGTVSLNPEIALTSLDDTTTDAAGTITNKLLSLNAAISAEKLFDNNTSMESLKDKKFTIILKRMDGNIDAENGSQLRLEMSYHNTTNSFEPTDKTVQIPVGDYEFWEETTTAAADGWQNIGLSGTVDGENVEVTNDGGVFKGSFTITKQTASGKTVRTVNLEMTATNKTLLKKVSVEISKAIDSLNNQNMDFTFQLYHKNNTEGEADELIAKVTIRKTQIEAEIVNSADWRKPDDSAFDIANYQWKIGDTYYIEEVPHEHYTLTSVTGATAYQETVDDQPVLMGGQFTITSTLNNVTLAFENTQNTAIGVTLQKKVTDNTAEPSTEIAPDKWPDGSSFTFGVFVNDANGTNVSNMRLLSQVAITDGTITDITVPAPDKLLAGGTYFLKEIESKPEGAYTIEGIKNGDTPLLDVGEGYYAFTAPGGTDKLALVATNNMQPKTLTIQKIRVGGAATDEFQFTVTINSTAYSGPYTLYANDADVVGAVKNTTDGKIVLKGGERAAISGLAVGMTYSVSEGAFAGYQSTFTVNGTKPAEGVTTAAGTLSATEDNKVVYTNAYGATGSITLGATKVLEAYGRVLADDDFTFTIKERLDGDTLKDVTSAQNKTDGSVSFDAINFAYADVGDHEYLIQETSKTATGLHCDTTIYTIVVNVADNGGGELTATIKSMSKTVKNAESGEDTTSPINIEEAAFEQKAATVFTNVYDDPAPVDIALEGTKTLSGGKNNADITDKQFSFTLKRIDDANPTLDDAVQHMTHAAEGETPAVYENIAKNWTVTVNNGVPATAGDPAPISFGDYRFTKIGEYQFELSETNGGATSYVYDNRKIIVSVNVTMDAATNALQQTTTYQYLISGPEGDALEAAPNNARFENQYTTPNKLTLSLKKLVGGNMGDRNADFTFLVSLRNKDDQLLSNTEIKTISVNGTPANLTTNEKGELTVTLKHGQTLALQELSSDWDVRVQETGIANTGYATTYEIDKTVSTGDGHDKSNAEGTDTDWLPLNDAEDINGVLASRLYTFTNMKTVAIPTGILLDIWPYLLIVLAAIGGGCWLMISKKRKSNQKKYRNDDWN